MKRLIFFSGIAILLLSACSCEGGSSDGIDLDSLPRTEVPAGLEGDWASGYSSYTQVVDSYTGQHLQAAWQSGKFFRFKAGGAAEFYYMADGYTINSATKAEGTVAFDPGSTAQSGSFTFYASKAHYNGWNSGSKNVDRDATATECRENLTAKYYYENYEPGDGKRWLRIEPGAAPTQYTTSFRKVD
jgi:hypothetical protein